MDSEAVLIAQLKDPSCREAAFRELVETYQERLYWHIRRIVLSHADADDVLQNTFIKIYRHIEGFHGDSKLYSWMYRIGTNEALSFLKTQARMKAISEESLQQQMIGSLSADPYFDGDHAEVLLQRAIASLPEKQRLVFNMKYFDELKYQEISEILDTSVGALKASYHLASKKIEGYLKEIQA